MAHFWVRGDRDGDPKMWRPLELGSTGMIAGTEDGGMTVVPVDETVRRQDPVPAAVVRRSSHSGPGEGWALLPLEGATVVVNGAPVRTGLRVLQDRDAVQVAGGDLAFFSVERLAVVEPHRQGEHPVPCPRCRLPIEAGHPSVRCPKCGTVHHQFDAEDLPCWSFGETCANCDHPATLDAGFRWTPEVL